MSDLPNPLTPADCNLRDFGFMQIDVKRLLTSETWILGTGEERAAAITLWLESWHQVPAASLPDDDRMLAHLSQSKSWKKVKSHALRGWVRCADGRFYHPVVAEKSLEAWIEKLLASLSGAAGNAKRWGVEVDIEAISARVIEAVDLLKTVAPQSKTLRKKQVVAIVSGSQPYKKPIAPRSSEKSPPESPPDRNREGEGEREGEVNNVGAVIASGESPRDARDDDATVPKDPAEWARYFRDEHGIELQATNVHHRNKAWPLFLAWIKAGITIGQMNAAVKKAHAEAETAIAFLPAYVDRVLATMSVPQKPQFRSERDESRRRAYEVLTGKSSAQPDPLDEVINGHIKLIG